ncbi:MAG: efflux RND transporter periplasmic adaptor subunit [Legionella sp.]|uniref:efflux RND transporter periplasmic adaptor subunit n=1 Tax=Legionella sp. TaxID=459 RepID=UPI0039E4F076
MFKKVQPNLKSEHHRHRYYVLAAAILLLIFLSIIVSRIQAEIALKKRTQEAAVRVVATMVAKQEDGSDKIVLPGTVRAWHEAPIYARVNGYVNVWNVDIGSRVKAGDILAVIETPELDAQKRQAEADFNTAIANDKLAQSTAKRWLNLLKTESVSKQETDEKVSSSEAMQAARLSAKANLDRLNDLVNFQQIIAPFTGVITARATDIGDLVNAGSSISAKPLFRIAQTDPLRIYVEIPQYYTTRITPEMTVTLHFAEHPHREFSAKLLNTANAINPNTRTLLAQFAAENKDGVLLPGGYTEVWFTLPLPPNTILLPVNTLLFQAQGLQAAIVDKNNKIVLRSVTVRRDLGAEVEIATGVLPGDRVVVNPPDSITEGEVVRISS